MSKKRRKKKNQLNTYIKYSAFAIQITFVVFFAYYFGELLDKRIKEEQKTFTTALSLAAIFGSLYWFFYKIKNDKNH